MTDLSIFNFESFEVRYVGDGVNHEWIAQDVCDVLGISEARQSLRSFSSNQRGVYTIHGRSQNRQVLTVTEPGLYRLIFKSRKKVAERFQEWVFSEVLPAIREHGSYSLESNREKLERSLMPKATLKEIDQCARMLGKRFGKAYEESCLQQMIEKHKPHLIGETPSVDERSSLKSAKALLTPTMIAAELGLYYKTGNPSPKKVNTLLVELGYQHKVSGDWSATDLGEKHAQRKPVATDSRSDKDQLRWYASILPILQEHIVTGACSAG